MKTRTLPALVLLVAAAGLAACHRGGEVVHSGPPQSPIAAVVKVPARSTIFYLSGVLPPVIDSKAPPDTAAAYGDTTTQAVNCILKIKTELAENGLTLGDVVMMRIYMVGDPTKGGKMDFAGMMVGYKRFFGTPEQPNKPSRSTVQVAALAEAGPAMEIEVQAAKAP